MKKKIFGGIAILAITAVTALNVNFNTQENNLSTIGLDNVEALANGESSGGCRFRLNAICSTSNSDHHLYRNN